MLRVNKKEIEYYSVHLLIELLLGVPEHLEVPELLQHHLVHLVHLVHFVHFVHFVQQDLVHHQHHLLLRDLEPPERPEVHYFLEHPEDLQDLVDQLVLLEQHPRYRNNMDLLLHLFVMSFRTDNDDCV